MGKNKKFMTKRHLRRLIKADVERAKQIIVNNSSSNSRKSTVVRDLVSAEGAHINDGTLADNAISDLHGSIEQITQLHDRCADENNVRLDQINIFDVDEEPDDAVAHNDDFHFQDNVSKEETPGDTVMSIAKKSFRDVLKCWAIQYRHLLTEAAINSLLKLLIEFGHTDLPLDARTLVGTPKKCDDILKVEGGEYVHLGIDYALKNRLEGTKYSFDDNVINMSVNIDGVKIFGSSQSHFWPILMSIDSENEYISRPFIAGLFQGKSKPHDVQEYLRYFVEEVSEMRENGFTIDERIYSPFISKLIADAPAKSFILCVKGHNGYSSCTKCHQEGTFANGRMSFPDLDSALRTDQEFAEKTDEEYHLPGKRSPLDHLDIGLVSQVPLDYMHLVCLGVMKRLLSFWIKGKQGVRMANEHVQAINGDLENINKYLPNDFARKCRALTNVEDFKATEFRLFLLYVGPIVLRTYLTRDQYVHFMALHCAIRILCSPDLYFTLNEYAANLLKYFVKNYGLLYGYEYISHNVHNLLHLSADSLKHGPLDKFSAFKFENYLGHLEKLVKSSSRPLQQVINRLKEREDICTEDTAVYPQLKHEQQAPFEFIDMFKTETFGRSYRTLHLKSTSIVLNDRDNHVILNDGSIMEISVIYEEDAKDYTSQKRIFLIGRKYAIIKNFYDIPCDSKELFNIVIAEKALDNSNVFKVEYQSIKSKCFRYILSRNRFLIMPLLHQF